MAVAAGLVLHLAVPAWAVLTLDAPATWLLSTLLFVAATARVLRTGAGAAAIVLVSLFSLAWMLLTVLFGITQYARGTGFDDAFFYHFNLQTVRTSFEVYTLPSGLAASLLVLAAAWPLLYRGAAASRRAPTWLPLTLLLGALVVSPPLHSLWTYWESRQAPGGEALIPDAPGGTRVGGNTAAPADASRGAVPARAQGPANEASATPKNIVLIYAEGLELAYFDRDTFGDLLPGLTALIATGTSFTNLHQLPGTNWTMAGLVASQCGFPLRTSHHTANNSTLASTQRPFANSTCLADVLNAAGYRTIFYGGADLAFAGKGAFLRTHGYEEVHGREELLPSVPDGTPLNEWGLYDETLFELAASKLEELERDDAPWLLTVLTVDTHFPRGDPSPGCAPLPGETNPMAQAIHCSDQLISAFIDRVRAMTDPSDTVIALFSDHLAFRTSLTPKMKRVADRRLLFLVLDESLHNGTDATLGSHFDIGPTLLDLAGVPHGAALGSGVPLTSRESARRSSRGDLKPSGPVPSPLDDSPSIFETGFEMQAANGTLSIGRFAVRPNRHGYAFETGLFLLIFDRRGRVQDTLYFDDFEKLLQAHENRFVVGLSVLEAGQTPIGFMGRVSRDPARIVQRRLDRDWRVSPEEVTAWRDR